MNQKPAKYDILWIISEICYYLGLFLAGLFIPALTFALWAISLADKVDPNYWYILIAWVLSALVFLAGAVLKNSIYSATNHRGNI